MMATMADTPVQLTRRRFVRREDDGFSADSGSALVDVDLDRSGSAVRRIVLTGGPGGGKSTAAAFLAREFVHDLWVLPEAATVLYREGMPRGDSRQGIRIAQRAIFDVQRSFERAGAEEHPGRVQLCDRATVDGAAYWPDGPEAFFASMGTTHERELARYDAVIFLHTAAQLPAGYERDVNVRVEEREHALELDRRVRDLYRAHPRVVTVRSTASFLEKIQLVTAAVHALTAVRAR